MAADVVTLAAHRAAYREHKTRADALKVQVDVALIQGIDSHEHHDLVSEMHDELICAAKHFTLAAILEEATT